MKKILASFAAAMAICIGCFAQTTVESELGGYVDISVKRCFKEGSTVYVDLVFNNTTSKDCRMTLWRPVVIDDEGNNYDKYSTYWVVEPGNYGIDCIVQSGITKKYRFAVKNMDPYAQSLQLADIQLDWDGCGRFRFGMWQITNLRLRRIPIEK